MRAAGVSSIRQLLATCMLLVPETAAIAARPIAMAADAETLLLVGGEKLHRISVEGLGRVSKPNPALETHASIGKQLVDVTCVCNHKFVAADAASRALIGLDVSNDVQLTFRCDLDVVPRRVRSNADGTMLCVTATWNRAVQIVKIGDSAKPESPIPLSFEPASLLALPNQRFLIADAFGGQLAVVDADKGIVVSSKSISGHQIRGLALTADSQHVLMTHQILSRIARTDRDDIHWGSLMQNVVSKFPLSALQLSPTEFRQAVHTTRIGDTGQGFADPVDIAVDGEHQAVLSMGARQLQIQNEAGGVRRVATGRRPIQMMSIPDGRLAVLCEQDGTLLVLGWKFPELQFTITIGDAEEPSAGEVAFYDASLSHDRWLSCNSCHVDGHTPALLADTFGDGSTMTPKRIPTLLGVADTAPFGWIGNRPSLVAQINSTLASTMRGKAPAPGTSQALSEYLVTLKPPVAPDQNASPKRVHQPLATPVENGRRLFESLRCVECHSPPRFTSSAVKDVGLADEAGHRMFNPPSLRSVRFRRRFFHDGRATSLSNVIRDIKHQLRRPLTAREENWLIAYLKSL